MDLESVWRTYQEYNYTGALLASLENLVSHGGIDYLHIAGLALMNMRRQSEGMTLLKAAATVRPESPHIYVNAAHTAESCGMLDEVDYFVDRGLADFPDNIDLLLLRANNYVVKMMFDQAETVYRNILERDPKHVQSIINLGNIHRNKDEFDEAEAMFAYAESLEPNFRDLTFARATMFTQRGEHDKAKALLESIAHDVDAQFLLSLMYLAEGDYLRGFRMYRARCHSIWYKAGNYTYPLKPFDHYTEAAGKKVAIIHEGGLGDMLQFARYVPKLAKGAKSVTMFTPPSLTRLLRYSMPETILQSEYTEQILSQFDYITTDAELPYSFRTTIHTIPNELPYLFVPDSVIEQHRLPPTSKRRVGLCWAGGPRDHLNQRSYDDRRSMELHLLAPLAEIKGIEFVSLQYGPRSNDTGMNLTRVIDPSFDFMDTAAIVAQLDLVVSVDTSVVHLAAGMGKPTWVLSRYDCCWRWLRNQPHNPWYPGVVRVFGQDRYRDWSKPLIDLKEALVQWNS